MKMIGNADPGAQAPAVQDQDSSSLSLARPVLAGGTLLSALTLFGVDPAVPTFSSEAFAAGPGVQCNLSAGTYNTILCSRSPKGGEQYCARAVTIQEPESLKGGYVDSGKTNYRVSFGEPGITGCSPAGVRRISVFQALRKGPAGSFEPNGPVTTIEGNKPLSVRKILKTRVDCSLPGMAGSAVEPEVKVTWVTAKGWPKLPKNLATMTFDGKTQAVC